MNSVELTLPLTGLLPAQCLEDWAWLLDKPLQPSFLSKFGDWFFFNTSGEIEMLDMIEGRLQRVASSSDEFNRLSKTLDKQSEWFLDGWVYRLHHENQLLESGQCYGFKHPPILGGEFNLANIEIYDVSVYNSLCGQLHRQLREKD